MSTAPLVSPGQAALIGGQRIPLGINGQGDATGAEGRTAGEFGHGLGRPAIGFPSGASTGSPPIRLFDPLGLPPIGEVGLGVAGDDRVVQYVERPELAKTPLPSTTGIVADRAVGQAQRTAKVAHAAAVRPGGIVAHRAIGEHRGGTKWTSLRRRSRWSCH